MNSGPLLQEILFPSALSQIRGVSITEQILSSDNIPEPLTFDSFSKIGVMTVNNDSEIVFNEANQQFLIIIDVQACRRISGDDAAWFMWLEMDILDGNGFVELPASGTREDFNQLVINEIHHVRGKSATFTVTKPGQKIRVVHQTDNAVKNVGICYDPPNLPTIPISFPSFVITVLRIA